ncbi:hypothetical protein [Winogradskyella haliclonae]|uniref:hypothetical protein n=1 Tax=Winogradskyella haliclonae TaxID=2048558 RepID=UPI00166B32F2|nr:hypothetical protein [Winogradskyella haliclonae]
MKLSIQNSIYRILAITLVLAILAPTLIKLSHSNENHKHEICDGKSTSHFHELDIDCNLCKFKLTSQYNYEFEYNEILVQQYFTKRINSQYNFISDYQKLQFSLRGPPSLI